MSSEILRDIKNLGSKIIDAFSFKSLKAIENPEDKKTPPRLDRHLSADGLELAFSTHTKEANQIFKMMAQTSERRKAREDSGPETPSNIVMSKPKKGRSIFEFEYHQQKHKLIGKPDLNAFTSWITEYAKTAESCITCDKLLMPGESAGACDDGLMHLSFDCCPDGGFYAGHINDKGKLEPLTEQDYEVVG